MDPWSDLYSPMFLITIFALMLSLLFIIHRIVVDNKKNISIIFFRLSKLPLLILVSHILLLLSGRTFNSEGGWWILYVLLIIGPMMSIILFTVGLLKKKIQCST